MQLFKTQENVLDSIRDDPNQVQLVTVSPDQAREWITVNLFSKQRTLRTHQVQLLTSLMEKGEFRRSELKFIYCQETKQYVLINGQHRLNALIAYGKPLDFTVTVLSVELAIDIADYYVSEDRGLGRSLQDTYGAYDLAEELGITANGVGPMAAALTYITQGLQGNTGTVYTRLKVSDIRRVELLREWKDEVHEFYILCPRGSDNRIRGTMWVYGPLAIELITMRYRREQAIYFWKQVLSQEDIHRGMPAYALVQYCLNRKAVTSRYDQDSLSRAFTLAWNSFFNHRQTQVLQPSRMKPGPYVIAGTPYDGKQWGPGKD